MSAENKGRFLLTGVPAWVLRDRFTPGSWFQKVFSEAGSTAEILYLLGQRKMTPEQAHVEAVEERKLRDARKYEAMKGWGRSDFKRACVDENAVLGVVEDKLAA